MNLFRAYRYPRISLLVITLITLFFAAFLPSLVINNDVVIFLPKNNPHRVAFENLHDEFGRGDGIIVAATVRQGYVYDRNNLLLLDRMSEALLDIDSVDAVLSLANIDYVEGTEGMIETFPLVRDIPQDNWEEEQVRKRLEDWNIYENTLYTEDFKTSLILIRLMNNTIKRDEIVYEEVMDIVGEYKEDFDIRVAGLPAVFVLVGQNMNQDLSRLIPFVILVVLAALWFSFRRLAGILLPMITVVISTVWSLGLMSLLGIEMTMIATVIPVLLVAVGSAYGIHIMSHYFDLLRSAGNNGEGVTESEHEEILNSTLSGVGKAVMLAAMTTMAGFGSLAVSGIVPVRDFGIFTCVGVFSAFIVAIVLTPSLLHLFHCRANSAKKVRRIAATEKVLGIVERVSHYPVVVGLVIALIIVAAVLGTLRIRTGNAVVNYFRKSSSVWQSNNWLQENTNGTSTLSVMVRGQEMGSLAEPEILLSIDEFSTFLTDKFENVKKVGSLTDLIKRINVVMHAEEIAEDSSVDYNEIPSDPAKYGLTDHTVLRPLISQYLMLFSGEVDQYADDGIEPSVARIMIQINTSDVDSLAAIRKGVIDWFDEHLVDGYTYEIAGTADAEIEVNRLIVDSQIKSILFSLAVVFVIVALFFRSGMAGLCGMFCLAVPLLINFGVMGYLNIRLDVATAMVSSIAIGIGIDYMIHFMTAYSRILQKNSGQWEGVSQQTIMTCGKPILFNAVSVALGFSVILFSNFVPLTNLGAMIFLTMLTSSLASLTILPVVFNKFRPSFLIQKSDHMTNTQTEIPAKNSLKEVS